MSASPPAPEDITVVQTSHPDLAAGVEVAVVVPTFKRPEHLVATLRSVLNQNTSRSFAVVVMDNHAEQAEDFNDVCCLSRSIKKVDDIGAQEREQSPHA